MKIEPLRPSGLRRSSAAPAQPFAMQIGVSTNNVPACDLRAGGYTKWRDR